ncbi:clathrin-coated vesicle protein [Lasiosphaeria ovina]|uniref:Clathrin-coated vesicle protein n=1 Tax=Lasiosphaeria ovina TaxID=92902 RepID=A0AAE0TYL7_9PEZI|nr:clathrin-coated vesicle protein [Lasiosphaeria ovina]
MFSSVVKSISSTNISSNYTISPTVTSTAGPWKIYSAKKKSTGKDVSVFVFDRKSLDAHSSGLGRSGAAAFKKVVEGVVERLEKEAASLARLRHPNVLELVEPVEKTRGGGLQFATEAVTASLASLLEEKDEQEKGGGVGGRSSRWVTEDADGTRRRRELEIDELEIQKGLLQISKALEFLHETAGLVHGNLTPDAILINAKSDWKISGLSFCGPAENSSATTSVQPIDLVDVLHLDPRLPRSVQLSLDYTSPDFVLDNNLTSSADMFSLGLLCVALYNSPHRSPIECNSSVSNYKRLFQNSQGVPSSTNNFLSSRPLPKELATQVLPRLITRRPAQRMTAKEFQQSEYFDNILISTIRFLDAFPAKTPNEKSQFLRGLIKVLPSFPKSVMEKKVLPALLDELKDRELLSLILHNVFKIIELLPSGKRAFGDRVRPSLKEIFVTNAKQTQEKDAARDAGLMIILEQLGVIANNCLGKEFKDDILPIIFASLESPTPTLVDAALRSLPTILSVLDFSTIKNELFPVIATIFSKTNSLAIKVRGLQAFVTLCGGSSDPNSDDGLDGFGSDKKRTSSSSVLDKFTMQEKIVPLVKGIKTKEPAVMIAALNVLKVVGKVADADFVAMDILPILWSMSLGPLLDLKQFQGFMDLIKTLSRRVEDEQTKKLQELSGGGNGAVARAGEDFMSFGAIAGSSLDANGDTVDDFELLVKGKSSGSGGGNPLDSGWDSMTSNIPGASVASSNPRAGRPAAPTPAPAATTPAFSWSSSGQAPSAAPATSNAGPFGAVRAQQSSFRTVTPDLARFETLTPTATQFSQPLQPTPSSSIASPPLAPPSTSINWGTPSSALSSNPWSSPSSPQQQPPISSFGSMSLSQPPSLSAGHRPSLSTSSSFALSPPPASTSTPASAFSLAPPPGAPSQHPQPQTTNSSSSLGGMGMGIGMGMMNMNSMGSSSSIGAAAANRMMGSNAGTGMGMGMGMAAMRSMGGGGGGGGNTNSMGMSMNSMSNMMNLGSGTSLSSGMGMAMGMAQQQQQTPAQPQKSGLDKYQSLL